MNNNTNNNSLLHTLTDNICTQYLNLRLSIYFNLIEIFFVISIILLILVWIFFSNYRIKNKNYFLNINKFLVNYLIIIFMILFIAYGSLFWYFLNNFGNSIFFIFFGQIKVTSFIILFKLLISFTTLIYLIFLKNHLKLERKNEYKFIILIPFTCLGSLLLVQSNDFITLILSIEIMALSLYAFVPSKENNKFATEASLKYYIIGSVASSLLILGCSIVYLYTGTINLEEIKLFLLNKYEGNYLNPMKEETLFLLLGVLFIYIAILIKIGVAPFHFWIPEVYGGSPLIILMFISLVPKIAYFGILITLTFYTFAILKSVMDVWFIILGVVTIILGVFGSIYQLKVRKFLAYSMFTNTGLFVAVIGLHNPTAVVSVMFSLILYIILMINLFGSFLLIYDKNTNKPFDNLNDISNLFNINPILSINIGLTLISLAGLPFLSGFFIKFELLKNFFVESPYYYPYKYSIISSLFNNFFIIIGILLIILSLIASFYYLRILKLMFFEKELKINTLLIKQPDFGVAVVIALIFLFNLGSIFFINTILMLVDSCLIP